MDAYVPLESLETHVGDLVLYRDGRQFRGEMVELSQITVSVNSVEIVDETASIIQTLLKKYHDKEDYAVVVPKVLLQQAARTRAMFNVLLVVIAGISLLVGGIGIMNKDRVVPVHLARGRTRVRRLPCPTRRPNESDRRVAARVTWIIPASGGTFAKAIDSSLAPVLNFSGCVKNFLSSREGLARCARIS